jgi:hypothetical protein
MELNSETRVLKLNAAVRGAYHEAAGATDRVGVGRR